MFCKQLSTRVGFMANTTIMQVFLSLLILRASQLMAIKITLIEISLWTIAALKLCIASLHVCIVLM